MQNANAPRTQSQLRQDIDHHADWVQRYTAAADVLTNDTAKANALSAAAFHRGKALDANRQLEAMQRVSQ